VTALARLRGALALFFIALAVPTAALIYQAYQRLQWETFHQHQGLAEEFATRVDQRLGELLAAEDARPFTEYSFFNLVTPANGAVLQRSPLAAYPPPATLPGLIGHFQVDSQGMFSAPYVPPPGSDDAQAGLGPDDHARRAQLAAHMRDILAANRLVSEAPRAEPPKSDRPRLAEKKAQADKDVATSVAEMSAQTPPAQVAFDSLNAAAPAPPARGGAVANSLGRVADLKLEQNFQGAPVMADAASKEIDQAAPKTKRALRKEAGSLPQVTGAARDEAGALRARTDAMQPIHTFESEVDGFESSLLASGELVLYRKVWRDGQRYVQGLLIDRERFLNELVAAPFTASPLAHTSSLLIARRGEVLLRAAGAATRDYDTARELRGTLLYQSRLSAPFSDFEVIFSVTQLPAGPGATVIGWLAAVLALVLCGGLLLMFRLGARQLALARQQQEFIAAVSHELKTPLTSIRMYGEMLREGWAPPDKHQEYYSFIHDEAERLTRLINNVLNLARMTRNELTVELREVSVAQLVDVLHSKLASVVQHAGRRYVLTCAPQLAASVVRVDLDCFTQVLLNLTDNALKFSSGEQAVEITVREADAGHVEFAVRDFGAGIPKDQFERIFGLFYRGENALTRATAGTGIGLALVKRLVEVMQGRVTVVNCEPGAEFRVCLPRVTT
jgi:signal transduction histidine kinase